ncbi:MAG: hypothetical protein CMJ49_12115 [Planctomycetaceae bacterium]|nr:hypothetical protein [Planctomycetaceae bacterium]
MLLVAVVAILIACPDASAQTVYTPTLFAGSADVNPRDSPANRVDANTAESPFAGIGSLTVGNSSGMVMGSAVAISPRHILTAAHLLDGNNDGIIDALPASITFRLNAGGNFSDTIKASGALIHPDFTGFLNPSLNDDLAIVVFDEMIPATVPVYEMLSEEIGLGTEVTMVGYGRSGYGDVGESVASNGSVKRTGRNVVDVLGPNDEPFGPTSKETFFYDFDGPFGTYNALGGPTLGNRIETIIAPGDSGGPSLMFDGEQYLVAGINTFVGHTPSLFSTTGGGMALLAYYDWLVDNVFVLPGDVNFDGVVDIGDLAKVGSNFMNPEAMQWRDGDLNGDGVVDVADMGLVGGHYGDTADYTLFAAGAAEASDGSGGEADDPEFHPMQPSSNVPGPPAAMGLSLLGLMAGRRGRRLG